MNTNTTKKTNKKGFTLVELVVVIAILAILAAIAIPVVANTINSSTRSAALSNAQTLELALKEADAMIKAGDTSIYTNGTATTVKDVCEAKSIKVDDAVTVGSAAYTLTWSAADDKCYYVDSSGKSLDDSTPTTSGDDITSDSTTPVVDLF